MSGICGNEEWLAAYLDRRLQETERSRFEAHLSRCPRCLAELIAAKAELDEMTGARPKAYAASAKLESPHGAGARLQASVRRAALLPRRISERIDARPLAAALSIAGVIVCVGALFMLVRSTAPGRAVTSAREDVTRVLATADIGLMRISNGPDRPSTHLVVFRGAEERPDDALAGAEKRLRAAIEQRAGDWRPYALLADLYMADNQIDRAESYYGQALARKPGDARLLNDRAAAEYRLGKFDLSRRNLERALAADSTLIEAIYNLVVLGRITGDVASSQRYLDLYLRRDPSSPWAERAKDLDRE